MVDEPTEDSSNDEVHEGKEAFLRCSDAESENRKTFLDDIRFSRLGEQWPADIINTRQQETRPCLTINKMPAFIRQVVNDARQNKPAIKVHPVDSGADVETADVMNGLIKNIEYTSNADVAYDTAIESSVAGGFGYWRIGLDYACDDSFEMDLSIERVANPLSVYGDPNSTSADSSDWNEAFIVDRMPKKEFKRKYKGKNNAKGEPVDWDSDAWSNSDDWVNDDGVIIAEWWRREEVATEIVKMSNGHVYNLEQLATDPDLQVGIEAGVLTEVSRRKGKTYKVTQTIMTGADVLEKNDWPGRYIPIVPVYGDEIVVEGKRYFRSLIHNAKDAQRMVNYWRTTATELVALAPRVPWIGRKGTFNSDAARWNTANTKSHAYLEFDNEVPQRQPLDTGVAAGALQEALNSSDDMKAIIGMYDASLGARSNETSGVAINARKREGDVATFHFVDNLARAIRHTGRILIDLIPKVYTGERIIRVIGEDGSQDTKKINAPTPQLDKDGQPIQQPQIDPNTGQPAIGPDGNPMMETVMAIHDLTAGKYDLTVTTGPSYTTKREEAAASMTEMIRAFPASAPVVGPMLAKALDWPGADDVARKLEEMTSGQVPPELQKKIEEGQQQIAKLTEQNQQLKMSAATDEAKIASNERLKRMEIDSDAQIAMYKADKDAEVAAYKATLSAEAQAVRPVMNSSPLG